MSARVRAAGPFVLIVLVLCSACAAADDQTPTALSAQPSDDSVPGLPAGTDQTTTTALVKQLCSSTTPCTTNSDVPSLDSGVSAATSAPASDTTAAPVTTVPACVVTLNEIVPGSSTQATLYSATLPSSLVGNTVSLIVDISYTVDLQDSLSPTEYLAWQPGDPQPSSSAAQIVALAQPGDGSTSPVSCPIPPGVIDSSLVPEQMNGFIDSGVLVAYQASLDAKINTAGVPKKGYGDTVRSVALPTPHHAVLIAYQRDRCATADSCASDTRKRQNGTETTSLYCVDIKGTQSTSVRGVTPLKDQYRLWPTVAQVAADMAGTGWCQ